MSSTLMTVEAPPFRRGLVASPLGMKDIDRSLRSVTVAPNNRCGPRNPCPACRTDVREEAMTWLRALTEMADHHFGAA